MSSLSVVLFLGGWLPPICETCGFWIPNWVWFIFKLLLIMYIFVWIRATLPRYRYDQLMRLGWKFILPMSLSFVFIEILFYLLWY
jgi:NADH-quinone oxidoreductase subunit H